MIERTAVRGVAPAAHAPGWAPTVLTPRGTAADRLSAFHSVWAELTVEDRQWFADWLTE